MTITKAERMLYEWQYGMLGSFHKGLFDIISRADTNNLERLKKAYPDEVEAVIKYKTESGYWEDVKLRMEVFKNTEHKVEVN